MGEAASSPLSRDAGTRGEENSSEDFRTKNARRNADVADEKSPRSRRLREKKKCADVFFSPSGKPEALKVLGYVNKFNRGIAKVRAELRKNGNPQPTFDVNRRTEFRVTVLPNHDEFISPDGEINPGLVPSGNINGTINGEIKIKRAIAENPGIKREGLLLKTKIPLRTIARILKSLKDSGAVEYRGSRKTGGWYPRT